MRSYFGHYLLTFFAAKLHPKVSQLHHKPYLMSRQRFLRRTGVHRRVRNVVEVIIPAVSTAAATIPIHIVLVVVVVIASLLPLLLLLLVFRTTFVLLILLKIYRNIEKKNKD